MRKLVPPLVIASVAVLVLGCAPDPGGGQSTTTTSSSTTTSTPGAVPFVFPPGKRMLFGWGDPSTFAREGRASLFTLSPRGALEGVGSWYASAAADPVDPLSREAVGAEAPDGRLLQFVAGDRVDRQVTLVLPGPVPDEVTVYDAATAGDDPLWVNKATFSPDGTKVAVSVAVGSTSGPPYTRYRTRIYDVSDPSSIRSLRVEVGDQAVWQTNSSGVIVVDENDSADSPPTARLDYQREPVDPGVPASLVYSVTATAATAPFVAFPVGASATRLLMQQATGTLAARIWTQPFAGVHGLVHQVTSYDFASYFAGSGGIRYSPVFTPDGSGVVYPAIDSVPGTPPAPPTPIIVLWGIADDDRPAAPVRVGPYVPVEGQVSSFQISVGRGWVDGAGMFG